MSAARLALESAGFHINYEDEKEMILVDGSLAPIIVDKIESVIKSPRNFSFSARELRLIADLLDEKPEETDDAWF